MKQLLAGIVTYHPDIKILKANIFSIMSQVDTILIVDNNSYNIEDIVNIVENSEKTQLLENKENYGIARALNQIFEFAKSENYSWVLTMDQDSRCSQNHVATLYSLTAQFHDAGLVGPVIVDRDSGIIGHCSKKDVFEVITCITSGSLMSVKAWEDSGKFDEELFIDSVDFDICYRLRKAGYKVYQTKLVLMEHKIGNSVKKRFLGHDFYILNHNAYRKYYIARNGIYVQFKNGRPLACVRAIFRNLISVAKVVFYEENKQEKIISIVKGSCDGIFYCIKNTRIAKCISNK